MDFTLALTHFCEVHGPKSVLCTQVLPLECALCLPPSPPLRAQTSSETLATQVHDSLGDSITSAPLTPSLERTGTAGTVGTNYTLPTDFSGASTTIDSDPPSPGIERHPLFQPTEKTRQFSPQFRYGRSQGDTCASCGFSVPRQVASKLPAGAPGSIKADGKSKNGAPVLRSREVVCLGQNGLEKRHRGVPSSQESSASSYQSFGSLHSHLDCHDHTLTYLTTKSPDDPDSYARLRASVIRTLSCEILPRGTSDGPLCFGDASSGYTIAYVFRLTDPIARGRRRAYAFVALAGKDASQAFKASPMLWEAFAAMARRIESAAQRHQDESQRKDEESRTSGKPNYTPISSFLAQRSVDPDGHPRRAGQHTPRSLADIVGDENIFAILHRYFIALLRCLGDRFGGLPLADRPSVYQSYGEPDEIHEAAHVHTTVVGENDGQGDTRTPTQEQGPMDDIDEVKAKFNRKIQRNSQCGPLVTDATAQPQLVI